ncbi:ABC transporter ATP-binding protein [Microvirga massiliensis]|uniref:ABC transporter ATP-binding protein n=1 Tax=Microvirga massiliensis TaxID=1033741 RepID=UPI00062BABFC|nr:ABC transporter ATP-binding protein [Microvirga massiliensis]
MLKVDGLAAGYGAVEVLHGVSLIVDEKQIVTVIGANGAGKSTLINTISRLIAVRAGSMTFGEHDLARLSAPDVVDLGIVQVPEGRQLFGPLTVRENLELGFQRQRRRQPHSFRERLDFVHELFPRLHERANQRTVTLSGGEQQMVAIGRALMADPQLLLLDEPSLGLAPLVIERIFEVLQTLRASGLTMLLVEQRAEAALELADYAYVLSVGRVVAEGPARRLRADDAVRNAYLGHAPAHP